MEVCAAAASPQMLLISRGAARRPWGIALTHDSKKAYVANGVSPDVSVIDVETHKVIASIPVGKMPWGVAIAR